MDCPECTRLPAEASKHWDAYLAEKHLTHSLCTEPALRSIQAQEELLHAYGVAAAKQRLHSARAHPQEGQTVRLQDLKLVSESET
jgi:hypothetical protein